MTDYDWMMPEGAARRRRIWPVVVPLILLAIMAAAWSAFWYSAAKQAERLVNQWLDREARLNRIYTCGDRSIEGFPFHIILHCDAASAQLNNLEPALGLNMKDVAISAHLYEPTVLIADFSGPLEMGDSDEQPRIIADWAQARAMVRGMPRSPERVSISLTKPVFERATGSARERLVSGESIELQARLTPGTQGGGLLLDISGKVVATSAPAIHPFAVDPIDADINTQLHGLKDFSPKSWPDRFHEIQQAGGWIEVRSIHMKQGEWQAEGSGNIGLNASGKLNGEMTVTVAGLDKLLKQLGVEEYVSRNERMNSAIGMLNQWMPGLGDMARERASTGAAAGLALLGQQTELGGRKATRLPLRFNDGTVLLGPIPIGQIAALF